MQHPAFVILRVPEPGLNQHSAHRIFGSTLLEPPSATAFMIMASMAAVNHMRAAAEAHHEIKENCDK